MYPVFVDNIPKDAEVSDLREIFSRFGDVLEVTIIAAHGFVNFQSATEALDAIKKLNGVRFLGERLVVEASQELEKFLELKNEKKCCSKSPSRSSYRSRSRRSRSRSRRTRSRSRTRASRSRSRSRSRHRRRSRSKSRSKSVKKSESRIAEFKRSRSRSRSKDRKKSRSSKKKHKKDRKKSRANSPGNHKTLLIRNC